MFVVALATVAVMPAVLGVDGRKHELIDEAHGKAVVVVFVSHDCPICNTYAPELSRIAKAYEKRVALNLVYAEPNLTSLQAREHAKAFGLGEWRLFLDPNNKLALACRATITPEAVVFDSKGRSAYVGRIDDLFYGFGKQRQAATRHDLRAAINAVLSSKPAKSASGPPFGCVIGSSQL